MPVTEDEEEELKLEINMLKVYKYLRNIEKQNTLEVFKIFEK